MAAKHQSIDLLLLYFFLTQREHNLYKLLLSDLNFSCFEIKLIKCVKVQCYLVAFQF